MNYLLSELTVRLVMLVTLGVSTVRFVRMECVEVSLGESLVWVQLLTNDAL